MRPKMLLFTIQLLITSGCVFAQTISCNEDSHCSAGYFCVTSTHSCRECLNCYDLNRNPPPHPVEDGCIRSHKDCGQCLQSFVEYEYSCESLIGRNLGPKVFWITWTALGLLISALFIQVILNTNIYKIERYYIPNPSTIGLRKNNISLIKVDAEINLIPAQEFLA